MTPMAQGLPFALPDRLTGDACTLHQPMPQHSLDIFRNYACDPEVTRFMLWRPHDSFETTKEYIAAQMLRNRTGAELSWVIAPSGTEEAIGMVSLVPDGHRAEIGYVLMRSRWGQGITTAAVRLVIDWAFSATSLQRIYATCAVANPASARVMAKAGMQREGILRGWHRFPNYSQVPQDCYIYGRLRDDSGDRRDLNGRPTPRRG